MAIVTTEAQWGSGLSTTNSYSIFSTVATTALSTGTDGIASQVITTSSLNGKKVMMGVEIVSAFSDVSGELTVQLSADGLNFTDNFATIISDTEPNSTGVKYGIADLTQTNSPFFRLVFNSAGNNVGTSGTLKFKYIAPP